MEGLLRRIKYISEKYNLLDEKTGEKFNVFEITDIATKEVVMCRVIHDLINPKGSHHQGGKYLKLFNEHVLKGFFDEENFDNFQVFREYVIDDDMRIDLLIYNGKTYVPMEVKIYAADQYRQCESYFNFVYKKTFDKPAKLFYLTLDGHAPSGESLGELIEHFDYDEGEDQYIYKENEEDINPVSLVSFGFEILNWIEACLQDSETIKIAPIREVLLQFKRVALKLTSQLGSGETMDIKEEIVKNRDSMEAAVKICNVLPKAGSYIIETVLEEIEKKVDHLFPENSKRKNNLYYLSNNKEKIETYYKKTQSTWPGISYRLKDLQEYGINLDIDFRIEIDHRLFAGFCTGIKEYNKMQYDKIKEVRKKKIFNFQDNDDSGWLYWEYLPDGQKKNSPDFKNFNNEKFLNLFDDDTRKEFIEDCVQKIEEIYSKWKSK